MLRGVVKRHERLCDSLRVAHTSRRFLSGCMRPSVGYSWPTDILSGAKNLGSCSFNELRRSFLRFTQDRLRFLRMTVKRVFS